MNPLLDKQSSVFIEKFNIHSTKFKKIFELKQKLKKYQNDLK